MAKRVKTSLLEKTIEIRNLTEDLIAEILVSLPVKSLLRFRCVCRSWFDLIESARFIQSHLNHPTNNENIIILSKQSNKRGRISFLSYESLSVILPNLKISLFNTWYIKFCGPCNGLICIVDGSTIHLCNPATREFKVLPPVPYRYPSRRYVTHWIGFGFDSIISDYKVVAISVHHCYTREENEYKVHIYNLSTNSWRQIQYKSNIEVTDHGTTVNRATHWIVYRTDQILSFDLSKEVFRSMELPHEVGGKITKRRLMVINESLALFVYNCTRFDYPLVVDIWIMHEYGVTKSWTKKFSVGPLINLNHPLLLWKNEAIIADSNDGELFLCDFDNHEMNRLNICGHAGLFSAMIYRESLIRLK